MSLFSRPLDSLVALLTSRHLCCMTPAPVDTSSACTTLFQTVYKQMCKMLQVTKAATRGRKQLASNTTALMALEDPAAVQLLLKIYTPPPLTHIFLSVRHLQCYGKVKQLQPRRQVQDNSRENRKQKKNKRQKMFVFFLKKNMPDFYIFLYLKSDYFLQPPFIYRLMDIES